ncbi:MAG: GNAT family N-acetyltransferase, partial [Candidatus Hydrogenedentes bacterium]|nr:GNAT family N-acetyltransferase [Candidatus Hydrogenedentota bacterium]
ECEAVVVIAIRPRQGVGRFLLQSLHRTAEAEGCRRLWLITTNNNLGAISFYRAMGWTQAATHYGAVREARRLKPEIPELDEHGTPIEDEVEFEVRMDGR